MKIGALLVAGHQWLIVAKSGVPGQCDHNLGAIPTVHCGVVHVALDKDGSGLLQISSYFTSWYPTYFLCLATG